MHGVGVPVVGVHDDNVHGETSTAWVCMVWACTRVACTAWAVDGAGAHGLGVHGGWACKALKHCWSVNVQRLNTLRKVQIVKVNGKRIKNLFKL